MHGMTWKSVLFWGFATFGLAAYGQQADHPVISEIRFYQHKDVNEEFVELYNPTCREVPLQNWKIAYKSKTGTTWHNKIVFGPNHTLKPHGFILWGGDGVTTRPDTVEASAQAIGLSNTAGHVALCDSGGTVIDKVAWGDGDSPEGTSINGKFVEGGSIERKANAASTALSMSVGGEDETAGNGYDTDDNNNDFVIHNHFAETNPQNIDSPPEPELTDCFGCGTCTVQPSEVAILDTVTLRFAIRSDCAEALREISIQIPSGWTWTYRAEDVSLEGVCFVHSELSFTTDAVLVSKADLEPLDSGTVGLRLLVAPAKAGTATFCVSSAKEGGSLLPLEEPPVLTVHEAVVPLIRLHSNDGSGVPLEPFEVGSRVMVSGVVTVGHGTFSSSATMVFLQDATAGISLYSPSAPVSLSLGDSVTVSGTIQQYRGMTEIDADWATLSVCMTGCVPPEPKILTCSQTSQAFHDDGMEPDEGRFIRIRRVFYDSETGMVSDSTGTAKLFIENGTGITIPPTGFDVAGILKQYKPGTDAPPYTSDYEIVPRYQTDLVLLSGPQFVRPPEAVDVQPESAAIQWSTDQESSGIVYFGVSETYSDTATAVPAAMEHKIVLTSLKPGTVYHYSVQIQNGNGKNRSDDRLFITSSDPSSTGEIQAYFIGSVETELATDVPALGNQDLIDRLVERIDAARYSVDMCFMKLDENNIRDALIEAANRGAAVRFICDDEYEDRIQLQDLRTAGIPVISDRFGQNEGSGRMHHKFAVFDHRNDASFSDDWVWTGSFNLTYYGSSPPAIENVVVVQDQALAEIYTRQFEEMWGSDTDEPSEADSRFGVLKRNTVPHSLSVGGTRFEVYFSPTDHVAERVIRTVQTADSSAYFCMFSFTMNDIAKEFFAQMQAKPGLRVRGVVDAKQVEEDGSSSEWQYMSGFADVLLDDEPGLLHHKYLIADADAPASDPAVATGSFNWTNKAEYENDENILIIHDAALANQYMQEFAARYHAAGGTGAFRSGVGFGPQGVLPRISELMQNHPNPFNQETVIRYQIPRNLYVRVSVHDLRGREVRLLADERKEAGSYLLHWNGRTDTGQLLASGVYFVRFQAGMERKTIKAVLLK
jgi:phosphatidylserine/phosphatidylglycerophosphate/cardiolipin synthase-like enzyme